MRGDRSQLLRTFLRLLRPFAGLLLVVLVFLAIPPHAGVSWAEVRTVAVQAVLVALVGMGMTLVIASGGIDLSVGSGVALCGVVTALASRAGWPLGAVVLAALATGAACGAYNGVLITALRLPAFITTLGTMGCYRGLAKWLGSNGSIRAPDHGLYRMMDPTPPSPAWVVAPGVWVALLAGAALAATIRFTVLGRHALAMGSNALAARAAGVPIARRRVEVYTIGGVLVALAAVLQFGRLTVGDSTGNAGLELQAVAAAVIGGSSLSGGRGSILGTIVGAVMMAYLTNRCDALGWPNYVSDIIIGHVVIAAVAIDLARPKE